MISFTSDTEIATCMRTFMAYAMAAAACFGLSWLYGLFSHGVESPFMNWMFLIPLIGSVLRLLIAGFTSRGCRAASFGWRLFNSGITTLIFGSCVRGILDIYGTGSPYVNVYWAVGGTLIVVSSFIVSNFRDTSTSPS